MSSVAGDGHYSIIQSVHRPPEPLGCEGPPNSMTKPLASASPLVKGFQYSGIHFFLQTFPRQKKKVTLLINFGDGGKVTPLHAHLLVPPPNIEGSKGEGVRIMFHLKKNSYRYRSLSCF